MLRQIKAWACVLGLTLLAAGAAVAQNAPAGNAHPAREAVRATGQPFGAAAPLGAANADVRRKQAFAAKVDLAALRDLAVYHNGRVKILETLARETVAEICERKEYFEYAHDKDSPEKVKFDPLFTFLDMAIDPGYYREKPLIGANYITLKPLLEAAFPGENDEAAKKERQRRTYMQRVEPSVFARVYGQMTASADVRPEVMNGLNDMYEAFNLYMNAGALLDMIPPPDASGQWVSLDQAPPTGAVGRACVALGAAWRAGDAAGVNAAAKTLAEELPKLQPSVYPGAKRTIERIYNASSPFEWGMWAYATAFLALLLSFGTGRAGLRTIGTVLLIGAVLVHAGGFAARSFIAERYSIQNQFESMTGVSLFAAVLGLVLMMVKRKPIFGVAAAGVGFLILIAATQTAIPGKEINREAAILNTSVLLKYHVTTVLVSYGLITLGMIVSVFYLATYYIGAGKERGELAGAVVAPSAAAAAVGVDDRDAGTASAARVLNDLDKAQMTMLQLAFWTLGVGILLGAWWADHSWGRWWAFDPKETWALVTWIIYLIVVHVRIDAKKRGLVTAWLSLLGFIAMLWCYFGVNLLLPGLHAYA